MSKPSPNPAERVVPCPNCRQPALLAAGNPWRPFCGERCRQIDMGAWSTEDYRVPARPPASPEDAADWDA